MASATPTNDGVAGEQRYRSGEFFSFEVGSAFDVAEPTADGCAGRRSRSRGRDHRRSAGGDGRVR